MRHVSVKYHIVKNSAADGQFPADELEALYRTAGIALHLVEGGSIDRDPLDSHVFSYAQLVEDYGATDREFGHIILGVNPREPDIAGELLDLKTRGVAVAYRNSLYMQSAGRNGLLQTCAHELGHMLNLDHDDVSAKFHSIMNQAERRKQDIDKAWETAADEAQLARARGEPDYFQPPVQKIQCYPFALAARQRLNTKSEATFQPWGSVFERSADAVNDVLSPRQNEH